MTTIQDPERRRRLVCDRCGWYERDDEPPGWIGERAFDAHLCPRCAAEAPWTPREVDVLRRTCRQALARSAELREESRAVTAQAAQALSRSRARPALQVTLPARESSVSTARRLLRLFAEGSRGRSDDLALLVTEIVTNALHHGRLPPDGHVRVDASAGPGTIRVTVHDDGPGVGSADFTTGHGLRIVDRLATRWGSAPGVVWFEL
jgi:signal transduction histidine kinase